MRGPLGLASSSVTRIEPRRLPSLAAVIALTVIGIDCGPSTTRFINQPPKSIDSISGILTIKSPELRRSAEAMVAIALPDNLRFEFTTPAGSPAFIILSGERAWCATPRSRLLFTTTVVDLSGKLLGFEITSSEIAALLSGAGEPHAGQHTLRVHTITDSATRFPTVVELTQGDVRARLRWQQIEFNTHPEVTAFDPPTGYDACDWSAIKAAMGL